MTVLLVNCGCMYVCDVGMLPLPMSILDYVQCMHVFATATPFVCTYVRMYVCICYLCVLFPARHCRMLQLVSMETVLKLEGVQFTQEILSTAVGWGRRMTLPPATHLWCLYLTQDTRCLLNTGLCRLCVCVRVCAYVRVCVCACLCIWMWVCMCACLYVCECVWMWV